MPVIRVSFNKIPYLGVFSLATDKIALFPKRFHFRERVVQDALGVPVTRANVHSSSLLGILVAGNSNGLVCSDLLEPEEEERLAELGLKVSRIPGRYTAFGNLVMANDNGALVNPDLPDEVLKLISESLEVPVERGTIAGVKNVGAAGVATNRGALVHPDVTSEELEHLSSVLGVPAEVGTACGGVKHVGLCLVANSNGAIAGRVTTGPELGRVENALGFI
jgi:translation initiation factor 6